MSEWLRVKRSSLQSVADKIKAKGGTEAKLSFPNGFNDAIDAIPSSGGDTSVEDAIITKTLSGKYSNDRITSIGNYTFAYCTNLEEIDAPNVTYLGKLFIAETKVKNVLFPNVTEINVNCFSSAENRSTSTLEYINLPKLINAPNYSFGGSSQGTSTRKLIVVDFGSLETIQSYVFYQSTVSTIIIRTNKVCTLTNTNSFGSTNIARGTGYIYVPKALVEEYKVATNWVTYADQIRAIEDYIDEIKLIYPNFVFGSEVA